MPDTEKFGGKSRTAEIDTVSQSSLPQSDLSRVLPRQLSIGTLRGTQNVGSGPKIDSSNNTITVDFSTGTQGIGTVPNTIPGPNGVQAGFFQTDSSGKVIWKLVRGTSYTYNPRDNYVNTILNGFAPDDGRPGIWVAKPSEDAYELLGGV